MDAYESCDAVRTIIFFLENRERERETTLQKYHGMQANKRTKR